MSIDLLNSVAALGFVVITAGSTLPPPPLGLDLYMAVPNNNPITSDLVMFRSGTEHLLAAGFAGRSLPTRGRGTARAVEAFQ